MKIKFSVDYTRRYPSCGFSVNQRMGEAKVGAIVNRLESVYDALNSGDIYYQGEDLTITLGKILRQLQERFGGDQCQED